MLAVIAAEETVKGSRVQRCSGSEVLRPPLLCSPTTPFKHLMGEIRGGRRLLRTRSLTNSVAKPKLASGVKNHGRPACYRLDRFQVRECAGEILAGYDDACRDKQSPTTCASLGRSSMARRDCIRTGSGIMTLQSAAI